jgi:hypothetical protein
MFSAKRFMAEKRHFKEQVENTRFLERAADSGLQGTISVG